MRNSVRRLLRAAGAQFVILTVLAATASVGALGTPLPPAAASSSDWTWPVTAFRLERPFVAPAHEYGPGHRGIDLRPLDDSRVRAPAPGVVAFSGSVAGRGILTIDHGGELVTTLEPVESELTAGALVARGEVVGVLGGGGHVAEGVLHFGVRLDGEYINPLLLLGGVPRAVLLPCC